MNYDIVTRRRLCLVLCGFVGLWSLGGCRSAHDYKMQADRQVYNIIDQKWGKDFGSRANYKISDTQPSPNDIQIEKAAPASGVLSLPQAVKIATAHNRQYQLEKELLYLKALDLRLARHEFEPQLFGGATGNYDRSRGEGQDEAVTTSATFGFNQLLAGGAIISTNVTAAWVDILTGDMRSGLTSLLSATITQPLLRGSGSRVVLENLTQAERDTVYQIRLFNRFRKTFVVSIISQYYWVLQQFDAVKNAESNYNILCDIHSQTEKLVNAGRLPNFELDRVSQDKLQAEGILVQAQKDYKQALDEFKIALGLPTRAEFRLDEKELSALRQAGLTKPDFSEDDIVKTALIQRLDLANGGDAITDAERKVFVAADSLRGELGLTAGTDFTNDEIDTDFTTLRTLKGTIDVGLLLNLPLERMLEQTEYRKALITFTQRQRDYEEAMDMVLLEVRQAYRDLSKAAERYQVQLKSLELARRRFDNTSVLLQYGRASSRRVLGAQEDLFKARNAATEALVSHTVATLNFYRDVGALHVRPDGMWEY